MFGRTDKGLLLLCLLIRIDKAFGFSQYNYDDHGFWSVENVLQCQKVSDSLIALAYLSISLELLYFVSCSSLFPFRWVLVQFGAFIVLCGLTHLVNVWTFAPYSIHVAMALTVLKFLTALVSCATSITLVSLIPQLLSVKVRERFLKKKTKDLDREVGLRKKQEEASLHVRMLTREIRKSLDRHTILDTTLVELSEMLFLENCVIWMPDDERINMNLTHELKRRNVQVSIPIADPDVVEINGRKSAKVLDPDSILGRASSHELSESGAAAAIRMPMLRVSNFKGGTPEFVEECYAILVLVLLSNAPRIWSSQELEIVEVVADQVAVALSHAAVLEESQLMREKLVEQNRALIQARENALMANEARCSFREVISQEMRAPIRSIFAILSILQLENLDSEQKKIVGTTIKCIDLLSTLTTDVTEISNLKEDGLGLEQCSFDLYSMLKEFAGISKLHCACRGLCFDLQVLNGVPNRVIGDEKRILQVLLHMIGNISSFSNQGSILLRVFTENGRQESFYPKRLQQEQVMFEEFTYLRFEMSRSSSNADISCFPMQKDEKCSVLDIEGLGFTICKRLAELMHGEIWVSPSSEDLPGQMTMTFVIRLKLQESKQGLVLPRYRGHETVHRLLNGSKILIAEGEGFNLSISRKLFEKLGCQVAVVSSWYQCLNALQNRNEFHLLLIDLGIFEGDGSGIITRIRKLRSRNWLRIIALVSKLNKDTQSRCLQNGMDGVLSKPIILQEMGDELNRIIQNE